MSFQTKTIHSLLTVCAPLLGTHGLRSQSTTTLLCCPQNTEGIPFDGLYWLWMDSLSYSTCMSDETLCEHHQLRLCQSDKFIHVLRWLAWTPMTSSLLGLSLSAERNGGTWTYTVGHFLSVMRQAITTSVVKLSVYPATFQLSNTKYVDQTALWLHDQTGLW